MISYKSQSTPLVVQNSNGSAPTALSADINASSAGANVIVAGVGGKILRVVEYVIVASGAVAVSWESSGGTVLGGPMAFAANGGAAPPFNPLGYFDTLVGEGITLYLGGAVQVGGHLKYLVTS